LLLAAWDSPGCSRRYRTPDLVLLIAPAGAVPATARRPSTPRAVVRDVYYLGTRIIGGMCAYIAPTSGWRLPSPNP
jgi:hypothetical protein